MPKVDNRPMTKIEIPWSSISPDPVQYKPYAPRFDLKNIFVEVEVPTEYILRKFTNGKFVFKPEAVPYIAHQLSLAIAQNYRPAIVTQR